MAIFSRIIFEAVKRRARRGLNADADSLSGVKQDARQRGVRGEAFAYWYLRRHGYVFVACNHVPREIKGEIDLIGHDGEITECDSGETASGWPHGAAVSDGEAREKVPGAVRCSGDRRIFRPRGSSAPAFSPRM